MNKKLFTRDLRGVGMGRFFSVFGIASSGLELRFSVMIRQG